MEGDKVIKKKLKELQPVSKTNNNVHVYSLLQLPAGRGGGGGTPLYNGYVRRQWVWFFSRFGLK